MNQRFIVFDTSTLVSAAIRPNSTPASALSRAFATSSIAVSADTLRELKEVLGRDKFDAYAPLSSRRDFYHIVEKRSVLFDSPSNILLKQPCRDPKDDKFLALALKAQAECIVSSDQDLLILHPWNGIRIISPSQFLDEP